MKTGKKVMKTRKAPRVPRRASSQKKTATRKSRKVRRVSKRGGMPIQYFGGPAPANLTTDATATTACKLPKTFGNCFKGGISESCSTKSCL